MSTTRGNHGDPTGSNGTRAMAELRAAVLLLADDDCAAAHQIADQIVTQVSSFRWRMQAHREREARTVEHLDEWLASQTTEPMAKHRHRPVDSKAVYGSYMGPLAGRYTNSAARGDRTRTDFCRCGGKRYTNLNGGQQEIGRWHKQLDLNLNPNDEKKKPPKTDGRSLPGIPPEQPYPIDWTMATPPMPPEQPRAEWRTPDIFNTGETSPPCCDQSPEARRSRFKVV